MTERPILFSAPMVRAILADRKKQTRRILKPQPFAGDYYEGGVSLDRVWDGSARFSASAVGGGAVLEEIAMLRHAPGDQLWVREAWKPVHSGDPSRGARYRADVDADQTTWRPSIHMPRWASRITLKVTEVRVQRLQDIAEEDAKAEGCIHHHDPAGDGQNVIEQFSYLWQSIHGAGSWEQNPWVAAISFERVK